MLHDVGLCNVCVATSSGQREGLTATEFGACYYNNMRVVIRVCCENAGQSLYSCYTAV